MKMRIRPIFFFLWILSQYYKDERFFVNGNHPPCNVQLI